MIKLSQNDQHMFRKSQTPLLRRKGATTCTKFGRSTKTVATCFAYIIGRKLSTKPTKAERASTVASGLRPLRQERAALLAICMSSAYPYKNKRSKQLIVLLSGNMSKNADVNSCIFTLLVRGTIHTLQNCNINAD